MDFGIPSRASVLVSGKWKCSTVRMISSFSDAGYLICVSPICHPVGDGEAVRREGASMAFCYIQFSRVRSATDSFRADVSARSSFTSGLVACRAVLTARRFFPASRKSLSGNCCAMPCRVAPSTRGCALVAAQAPKHDTDPLLC